MSMTAAGCLRLTAVYLSSTKLALCGIQWALTARSAVPCLLVAYFWCSTAVSDYLLASRQTNKHYGCGDKQHEC
jgi:hypothetical protein